MNIDRLKIASAYTSLGVPAESATAIATAIGEAYDAAEKDMASLKDLEVITAKTEAAINAAVNRQIIWIAGIAFTVIGAMIALKLWA
ncbi:MAG: hypothetical protein E5X53_26105 [Mesorhizobium sp.]|uniref:hypothetical protein n=1 Tax=Mesorhizobium sp. TaxID=1871066 RepID=UPI00122832AD|nr:hypothetical protein [Mesorhizobium sp.]TIR49109.1 MAG: hypothetical protein E5X53_26105 [Mesorhizobium sp.]